MQIVLIVLVAVALTEMAVLLTSIYLHRGLAHRSLVLHPAAGLACRVLLWLFTGQRRQEWVAVHRKHHTFTDREGDPHSPQMLGFWRVQLFNVYYYAREARKSDTLRRFAPDLAEDRLDRLVFSHGWTGLAAGTGVLCLALGLWAGAAAMVLHAVLYVFVLAPLINGLGHWHGRQTFRNSAYNIRLLSYVTGGESLHNNHHAHPRAAKFSMSAREYDPSWTVIRMLAALRVIKVPEVAAEASWGGTTMQVGAFSTPGTPDWRWRIVNYAGETIEESPKSFPTIALAMKDGRTRLLKMDVDRSVPRAPYRSGAHFRSARSA